MLRSNLLNHIKRDLLSCPVILPGVIAAVLRSHLLNHIKKDLLSCPVILPGVIAAVLRSHLLNHIKKDLLSCPAILPGVVAAVLRSNLLNAFGSVPHSSLFSALRSAGLTADQLRLIQDLYQGSVTSVRHNGGMTAEIPFGAGVRQGCPLSPLLFNLVMETLIRPLVAMEDIHGADLHGTRVSVLAYADDLALVAKSEASLRALLEAVVPAASWVGLKFKPAKCATLHVARRTVRPTEFTIDGAPLRVLGEGEPYQHLGVPTGMRVDQTPVDTIARLEGEAAAIFGSMLAPWQKLHALRTFLVPQLIFNFNTARIRKTSLRELDKLIKSGCKRVMNLPQRASAELIALPPSWGGAGLLPLSDLADLSAVAHAFRLLTSPDPKIAHLSLEGLAVSAGQRTAAGVDMAFLVSYLNGEIGGDTNVATTFSLARAALNRLSKRLPDLRWGWCEERRTFQLSVPGERSTITVDGGSRSKLSSVLRLSLQFHFRSVLSNKPDQGRAVRVTAGCPSSNHFLYEGRHTRFADWRFIHRARLNVLPLNGCRRWGAGDRRCRRCGRHDETTAHVLCHCLPTMSVVSKRHDAVLDHLIAAIRPSPGVETRRNQRVPLDRLLANREVPDDLVRLRPDVVVIDDSRKTIRIVDVTMPYEDGWRAIVEARERKHAAYAPLARFLRSGGFTVTVDAFVVGALGAWDRANWDTLARLGVSRQYGVALSRRCVSTAVQWSRDLYVQHVTGVPQYRQTREQNLDQDRARCKRMKTTILYPYEALNTGRGCLGLHAKHAAVTGAVYTLNISILVVLIYSWRISSNFKKFSDLQDVYYGVQIAYFAIIGTQLFMIILSIFLFFGIYKASQNTGVQQFPPAHCTMKATVPDYRRPVKTQVFSSFFPLIAQ
ncbi:uncharacterized protein LOC124358579 [Homalodisca vitripennis]|uniref:uncharacterized protein LOC124358579 n=1 Tax=Homalodisca vitripennis TaxID=197043 RepID=UPI001EECF250|nr:uncharacterized protein LOC124358579 [Homalodisca vitripennis]